MSLPPLRGSGSGVLRTPSNRLPLVPRNSSAPYVRPPPRNPSDSSHGNGHRPGGGAGNSGRPKESLNGDICQKLLDEMRWGREEQKGIREDLRRMSQLVTRLEENYQKLSDQITQQEEASFSIESSAYKVN